MKRESKFGAPCKPPCLQTERLRVSQIALSDCGVLYRYRTAAEILQFQSFHPHSHLDALLFILKYSRGHFGLTGTWFQLGVYLIDSTQDAKKTLIGDIGVHFIAPFQAELGYTIAPAYQGKRYAREATSSVIEHLYKSMGFHRISASVSPDNEASIALLKSLGFREEGNFRQSIWNGESWEDDLHFALLAEEWKAK